MGIKSIIINRIQKLKKYFTKEEVLPYYSTLQKIHKQLKPKKYIEVGVRNGCSIVMANEETECIGIDPMPIIKVNLSKNTKIFSMTSDDFFAQYSDNSKPVDLAFIDGMHLFEFVLRDFINLEKLCTSKSVILMHDTMPRDKVTASRDRTTDFWTGDVYKIIPILQKYRPDLKIYNSDAAPSGLAIVKNLNPNSTVLFDNYEQIVKEFLDYDFDAMMTHKKSVLAIKSSAGIKRFLK